MKDLELAISEMVTTGMTTEEILSELIKLGAAYDHRVHSEAVKRGLARRSLKEKVKSSQQQKLSV